MVSEEASTSWIKSDLLATIASATLPFAGFLATLSSTAYDSRGIHWLTLNAVSRNFVARVWVVGWLAVLGCSRAPTNSKIVIVHDWHSLLLLLRFWWCLLGGCFHRVRGGTSWGTGGWLGWFYGFHSDRTGTSLLGWGYHGYRQTWEVVLVCLQRLLPILVMTLLDSVEFFSLSLNLSLTCVLKHSEAPGLSL